MELILYGGKLQALCLAVFVLNAVSLELVQHVRRVRKHAPHGENRLLPDTLHELKKYTLEDFVQDFGRAYNKDTKDWKRREEIFRKNVQKVIHLRAHETRTWTPGITQFMDYHETEYHNLLGYKGRRSHALNVAASGHNTSSEPVVNKHKNITIPSILNVGKGTGKKLTNFVRDQGQCGSCWAAGAISTLEGVAETYPEVIAAMQEKATNMKSPMETLSTQGMVSCTKNTRNCGGTGGCDGATAELAYDMVKEKGLPLATEWLYTSGSTGREEKCEDNHFDTDVLVTISGHKVLPTNQFHPLIQELALNGHPIAIAVDATNWNYYMGGIYSDTDDGSKGEFTVNHEVTLMGYKQPSEDIGYWLIKNSWGVHFGEDGYVRIEMKKNEQEHCGWDKDTHIGLACDGDPDTAWVCGTCGILYDACYPTGLKLKNNKKSK